MKAKGEETAAVVSVSGPWVYLLREKLQLPGVPWLLLELREPTLVGRLLGKGQRAPG